MNAQVLVRRVLLARDALLGRLDTTIDLAQVVKQHETMITNLRRVAVNISREREYWYKLWFEMGREFESTQNTLFNEIDGLRKKLGMPESKWEEIVKAFHSRYVEPSSHPVPGIKVESMIVDPQTQEIKIENLTNVSAPPAAPDLSGDKS